MNSVNTFNKVSFYCTEVTYSFLKFEYGVFMMMVHSKYCIDAKIHNLARWRYERTDTAVVYRLNSLNCKKQLTQPFEVPTT